MRSEAACVASTLERTGRLVLNELKNMPEYAMNWMLPIPECHSLFDLATRLVETGEFWVQTIVGEQSLEHDSLLVEMYRDGERAYLIARYERWVLSLHKQLDDLPNDLMNMSVVLPEFYSQALGTGPITVRDCLLYAIEQTALHSGRIQTMCQIYNDLERLQEEFSQSQEVDAILLEAGTVEEID